MDVTHTAALPCTTPFFFFIFSSFVPAHKCFPRNWTNTCFNTNIKYPVTSCPFSNGEKINQYVSKDLQQAQEGGTQISWSGLDGDVPLEPWNPYPFLKIILAEKIPIFRNFSLNMGPFFTIFLIFLYKMGPMFRVFLWEIDLLLQHIPICLLWEYPPWAASSWLEDVMCLKWLAL